MTSLYLVLSFERPSLDDKSSTIPNISFIAGLKNSKLCVCVCVYVYMLFHFDFGEKPGPLLRKWMSPDYPVSNLGSATD